MQGNGDNDEQSKMNQTPRIVVATTQKKVPQEEHQIVRKENIIRKMMIVSTPKNAATISRHNDLLLFSYHLSFHFLTTFLMGDNVD